MHSEDRAEWRETDEWVVPTPTLKPGDRVTVRCGDATGTFTVPRSDQETPMPTITRTITVRLDPELVALLTEIRDRLPEPEGRDITIDEDGMRVTS